MKRSCMIAPASLLISATDYPLNVKQRSAHARTGIKRTQLKRLDEAAGGVCRHRPSCLAMFVARYLNALSAVAIESLAMKAAPHQSEPGPPGLIGVLATPEAVCELVKALQSPLLRLL